MSTAHLLGGLDESEFRLAGMRVALGVLGFTVKDYGASLCDKNQVDNTETQFKVTNAQQTSFADVVLPRLSGLPQGDIIIATAPWHHRVFKGLLATSAGKCDGTPVLELWIDYPGSFARWRIFSNYFILGYTMGQLGLENWSPDWIVAEETAESIRGYLDKIRGGIKDDPR